MIYSWKKIVKHALPLLTICIIIEIFAGQILQGKQEILILFPVFLISIPVINGVGGNIGSILGARLASGLHVGYISLDIKDKKMHENLFTSIGIGGQLVIKESENMVMTFDIANGEGSNYGFYMRFGQAF